MSHVTISEFQLQDTQLDLAALKAACEELGLVFVEGQKQFKWFGKWMNDYAAKDAAYKLGVKIEDYGKCEHVIRLPWSMHNEEVYAATPDARPYEIGVVKMPSGALSLCFDHWVGGKGVSEMLRKVGGAEMTSLKQKIVNEKLMTQLTAQKSHYLKRIDDLGNGKQRIVIGVKQAEKL